MEQQAIDTKEQTATKHYVNSAGGEVFTLTEEEYRHMSVTPMTLEQQMSYITHSRLSANMGIEGIVKKKKPRKKKKPVVSETTVSATKTVKEVKPKPPAKPKHPTVLDTSDITISLFGNKYVYDYIKIICKHTPIEEILISQITNSNESNGVVDQDAVRVVRSKGNYTILTGGSKVRDAIAKGETKIKCKSINTIALARTVFVPPPPKAVVVSGDELANTLANSPFFRAKQADNKHVSV